MGLIEVLVGAAVVTVVLGLSVAAVNNFVEVGKKTADRVAATYLAQEGVEAVRFMRDTSWVSLSGVPVDTARYLDISPTAIALTATPEVVDGFERVVYVRDVYRATAGDDIVASTSPVSKAVDPETKVVEVTVSAPESGVAVTLGAYLSNVWGESP